MQARIAIVGGGPGALSAALSLTRFGFPCVRVYERAAAYGPAAGAGFGLAFNGAAVLQALGLGAAISPALAPVRHWAVLDGERRGALVAELRDSPELVARGGLCDATLSGALRAEVTGALVRALPPGVLRTSSEVTGVRPGGGADGAAGPARITFADGSSEEADVVVAADGIRSGVRDALFGPSSPTYSGSEVFYGVAAPGATRGVVHGEPDASGGGSLVQAFGIGACFVAAPCRVLTTAAAFPGLPAAVDGGAAALDTCYYGFVRRAPLAAEGRWDSASLPSGAAELGDAHRRALLDVVGDGQWGELARVAAEATPAGRVLRFPMYFRKPFARWHRGRIALLGDAAHAPLPSVGQGLNMALEDGFVLAEELAAALLGRAALLPPGVAPGSAEAAAGRLEALPAGAAADAAVASALTAYQTRRFTKTSAMVNLSRVLLFAETGVPWPFASLRTRLLGASLGVTLKQLKADIGKAPAVRPEHLRPQA